MAGCNKMFNLTESYHNHITTAHQLDLQTYHKKFGTKVIISVWCIKVVININERLGGKFMLPPGPKSSFI